VLHRRPWRDTSLIIELLSAGHGRIAGVARGARSAKSAFFGLTEPFRRLEASWTRRGEMATLTGLEPTERTARLTGRAMWCGLYANELLLRLTPRDDPDPEIFAAYGRLLGELAAAKRQSHALRRFEMSLLNALGVAPDLAVDSRTGDPVGAHELYCVDPLRGPVAAAGQRDGVRGSALLALADGRAPDAADERAALGVMRELIEYQLDGRKLNTPAYFRENQS